MKELLTRESAGKKEKTRARTHTLNSTLLTIRNYHQDQFMH